jgi:hypothetical protein
MTMNQEYWVIGGTYRDLTFSQLLDGTSRVEGPFPNYDAAQRVWKERTLASRSEACTRFTIASHAQDPRRQAA